jgi:hypothetical protein
MNADYLADKKNLYNRTLGSDLQKFVRKFVDLLADK